MRILRDPNIVDPTGGNDSSVVLPKASTGKSVVLPAAKEPPKEVLNQEFSVADYEVTQLDSPSSEEKSVAAPVLKNKVEAKPSKKEVPEKEVIPVKKPASDISNILKAPVGKEKPAGEQDEPSGEKKEVIKTIGLPTKIQRDYNGYNAEQVAVFKQMSDPAYKYVTELMKEKKQLESYKDSNYLQHPDAYILNPEFRKMQEDVQYLDTESKIWGQQLALIKNGKPWHKLTGWSKSGQPIYGTDEQPTPESEEQVRVWMNQCIQGAQQGMQKLQTYPEQYKSRIQQDLSAIKQEEQKRFAWVADPTLLEHSVNIEGIGDRPLKDIKTDFVSLFPPYLQSNPVLSVASNLFIALQIQGAQLRALQSEQQVTDIKEEELEKKEPSSNLSKTAGKTVHGHKDFTLDIDL